MRHQSKVTSPRSKTVLRVLAEMASDGASTKELQEYANITRASDAIYDLRHPKDGEEVAIVSVYETENGKTYKRYWLAKHAPAGIGE